MKTTIKLGMLTAAFLLAAASCSNAVKMSAVADDSFRANATDAANISSNGAVSDALTVKSVVEPVKYGGVDNKYRIVVAFSKPVTDSVKNAITFYALTPSNDADKNAALGAPLSADITVNGEIVYCDVTGKDVYLYMKVKGSAVKAVNGQVMNQDEDAKWAEDDDDDYVVYHEKSKGGSETYNFKLGNPTKTLGITTYLNHGSDNVTYKGLLTPTFKKASAEVDSSNVPVHPELGDLINKVEINFNVEDNGQGIAKDDFTSIIKDHLRIEHFVDGEWKEVSADFGDYHTDTNTSKRGWSANLALKPNTKVRYKWIKLQDMPALQSSKYSYKIKYEKKTTENIEVQSDTKDTGHAATDFVPWKVSDVLKKQDSSCLTWSNSTDKAAGDHVDIELDGSKFKQNLYISKEMGKKDVTPKKDNDNKYYIDFAGFEKDEKDGLTPENFKVVFEGGTKYTYSYEFTSTYFYSGSVKKEFTYNFSYAEAQVERVEAWSSNVGEYPKALNKVSVYYRPQKKPSKDVMAKIFTKERREFVESDDFYQAVLKKLPSYYSDSEREAKAKQLVNEAKRKLENGVSKDSITDSSSASSLSKNALYMNASKVKIAGFTGTYTNGSEKKDIAVPALGFMPADPSADYYVNNGYLEIQ